MTIDGTHLAAILAMALATYGTRVGGLWLARIFRPGRATQAALDAVPVAVLTAVIAPALARGGLADAGAAVVTVAAACTLPLLPAVVAGVVTAVVLRSILPG
jgi:uncharacterized membrane protein